MIHIISIVQLVQIPKLILSGFAINITKKVNRIDNIAISSLVAYGACSISYVTQVSQLKYLPQCSSKQTCIYLCSQQIVLFLPQQGVHKTRT